MRTIVCATTFLDGRDRFEQGETRVVDDDRAARFIAAGWAQAPGTDAPVPAPASEATLDIHDVTHLSQVTYG